MPNICKKTRPSLPEHYIPTVQSCLCSRNNRGIRLCLLLLYFTKYVQKNHSLTQVNSTDRAITRLGFVAANWQNLGCMLRINADFTKCWASIYLRKKPLKGRQAEFSLDITKYPVANQFQGKKLCWHMQKYPFRKIYAKENTSNQRDRVQGNQWYLSHLSKPSLLTGFYASKPRAICFSSEYHVFIKHAIFVSNT
jgi:hypothetical protein